MKISKSQLRKIVKEELGKSLDEMARKTDRPSDVAAGMLGALGGAATAAPVGAALTLPGGPLVVLGTALAMGTGAYVGSKKAQNIWKSIYPDILEKTKPKYLTDTGEEDMLKMLVSARITAIVAQEKDKSVKPESVEKILDEVWAAYEPKEKARMKFEKEKLKIAMVNLSNDEEFDKMGKIIKTIHNETTEYLKANNMLEGPAAAISRGVDIAADKIQKAQQNVPKQLSETKLRTPGQSARRASAVGTLVGGTVGIGIGALLGLATGVGTTPATTSVGATVGAGMGGAVGIGAGALYDKYLLSKVATESDLVHIGKLKKEESLLGEEPWDINLWLDEAIGSLSSSQKESIIYEEGELLEAGQKEEEEELASQIIDYLSKEGMLDTASEQSLPAEEVPQIGTDMGIEDEHMIAESFRRMRRLAGLK